MNRRNRLILSFLPFLAALISLVAVSAFCIDTLHGLRVFIQGENLWSKAEKQAAWHVLSYSYEPHSEDLLEAVRSIEVTKAYRICRIELEKDTLNSRVVTGNIVQGGLSAQDAPSAIRLFRGLYRTPILKRAIAIWRSTDAKIDELESIIRQLSTESEDPRNRAQIRERVIALDRELTALQVEFSDSIHRAARLMELILVSAITVAALVLFSIAAVVSHTLQRRLRQTEAAQRESEILLQTAFRCFPDGVTITRAVDGKIIYANAVFCRMLKKAEGELAGVSTVDLGIWNGAKQRDEHVSAVREGDSRALEIEFRDGDGNRKVCLVSGEVLPMGAEECLLTVFKDITARKISEEQLHAKEQQLYHSQRIEAIGVLAGGVAHDFNNLLMIIQNCTDAARESLSPEHPAMEDTQHVLDAAQRAADLTRQLLAFSRKQVLLPSYIDINQVVNDTAKMLKRLIGEEITIEIENGSGLYQVLADPGQISQVVMNLGINSRDAMPNGGRLHIRTANVNIAASSNLAENPPEGEYVLVEVIDTGKGIPKHQQSRVFEPFYTTKEFGRGTGLGLSTVYGIVKQSGGYVYLSSQEGVGTTFKIFLPRRDGEDKASPDTGAYRGNRCRGTILLVEDEVSLLEITAECLRKFGYKVITATNGLDAIEKLRNPSVIPDILISDIRMPGMGGVQLAETLKPRYQALNVLFMSGYPEDSSAISKKGARLLRKPFRLSALRSEICLFCRCVNGCDRAVCDANDSRLTAVCREA